MKMIGSCLIVENFSSFSYLKPLLLGEGTIKYTVDKHTTPLYIVWQKYSVSGIDVVQELPEMCRQHSCFGCCGCIAGTIPTDLGTLGLLEVLNLSHNTIEGEDFRVWSMILSIFIVR